MDDQSDIVKMKTEAKQIYNSLKVQKTPVTKNVNSCIGLIKRFVGEKEAESM